MLPERQAVATVGYAFKARNADQADHAVTADTASVALNVSDPASSCLWQTDGTNVYRLTGKVGVGIDPSPSTTRLRVSGIEGWTGYFTQTDAISDVRLAYQDGRGLYVNSKGTANPYIVRLAYDGSSVLDVQNNGNVGLGTASPEGKLHVVGSAVVFDNAGDDFRIYGASDAVEHNHYLKLLNATNLTSAWGLMAGGILVSDSYSYATPGKSDLIVKGSVGVGTPTPVCMMELKKDVGSSTTLFKVSGYDGDANMVAIKSNGTILTINQTGTNDSQKGLLINHTGPGYGAYVVGNTYMDGDLCVTGAKNAVVPTSRGMTKVYSEESAETWFTDYGSGSIVDGRGHVELDPRFL